MFSEIFRQRLEKLHQYKIMGIELDIIFTCSLNAVLNAV
jgi:hypothetical protein